MREAAFILLVILALLALTAFRYRRGIIGAWQIWRSFKELKGGMPAKEERIQSAEKENTLVRCVRCGTWVPKSRSISMRGGVAYCSRECVELKAATR